MFWKFDLHPSSAIDTMLTREVSLGIRFALSRISFVNIPHDFFWIISQTFYLFIRTVLWAKYWTKMTYYKKRNHKIGSWSTCKLKVSDPCVSDRFKLICFCRFPSQCSFNQLTLTTINTPKICIFFQRVLLLYFINCDVFSFNGWQNVKIGLDINLYRKWK